MQWKFLNTSYGWMLGAMLFIGCGGNPLDNDSDILNSKITPNVKDPIFLDPNEVYDASYNEIFDEINLLDVSIEQRAPKRRRIQEDEQDSPFDSYFNALDNSRQLTIEAPVNSPLATKNYVFTEGDEPVEDEFLAGSLFDNDINCPEPTLNYEISFNAHPVLINSNLSSESDSGSNDRALDFVFKSLEFFEEGPSSQPPSSQAPPSPMVSTMPPQLPYWHTEIANTLAAPALQQLQKTSIALPPAPACSPTCIAEQDANLPIPQPFNYRSDTPFNEDWSGLSTAYAARSAGPYKQYLHSRSCSVEDWSSSMREWIESADIKILKERSLATQRSLHNLLADGYLSSFRLKKSIIKLFKDFRNQHFSLWKNWRVQITNDRELLKKWLCLSIELRNSIKCLKKNPATVPDIETMLNQLGRRMRELMY